MSKESIVNLKVFIQSTGLTKTMRFGWDLSVADAIKEIRDKANIQQATRDHGLFCPPTPAKAGFWMAKNRALRFYGLSNNDTIEFKKKHRPLRVFLADETQKMVIVDDSGKVRDIADSIGERLGVCCPLEFSLRWKTGPNEPYKWLVEKKTFHEQGVKPDEELYYGKKFFVSDDQIDKDQPATLHLLYIDALKAVIEGRIHVTRVDARDFAAFQLQIVYGDHNPAIHVPGFMDKNIFLPVKFRTDKTIEQQALNIHKRLNGYKEETAKFRYVQLVRSLKSYGVTYYHGKTSVGVNKYVPMTIGLSKSKVLKVDFASRRTLESWDIEELRCWTSERGVLTLDFGEYANDYVTLVTEQADEIAAQIAGYIDIILKLNTDDPRKIENEVIDVAEEEDMNAISGYAEYGYASSYADPMGMGAGQEAYWFPDGENSHYVPHDGPKGVSTAGVAGPGSVNRGRPVQSVSLLPITDMGSGIKACRLLATELGGRKLPTTSTQLTEAQWAGQFKKDSDKLIPKINDLIASGRLGPSETDRRDLDKKTQDIMQDLKGMAAAARHLTDLNPENEPLLDGTRAMADTVGNVIEQLLKSVESGAGPENPLALMCAEKQLKAAQLICCDPSLANMVDPGTHVLMLECIKDINMNLDVLQDIIGAGSLQSPPHVKKELMQEVGKVNAIKGFILARYALLAINAYTHSLPMCAKYALDPQVLAVLQVQGKDLLNGVTKAVEKARIAGFPQEQMQVLAGVHDLIDHALVNLSESAKIAESRDIPGDIISPANNLLNQLANLRSVIDQPEKAPLALKGVERAHNGLMNALQSLTQLASPEEEQRYLGALAELAKLGKELPQAVLEGGGKCLPVIGRLETQTQEIIADAGTAAVLRNLRYAAKANTAGLMKLATISNKGAASCNNPRVRADLLASAKGMQTSLSALLSSLQVAAASPEDISAQSKLMSVAQQSIPGFHELSATRKQAAGAITDPIVKDQLTKAAHTVGENAKALERAIQNVEDMEGQTDIDAALAEFEAVKGDLETAALFAQQGMLAATPGQTRSQIQPVLNAAIEDASEMINSLVDAAKNGSPVNDLIKQSAYAMGQLGDAARSLASTIADRDTQGRILGSAKDLVDSTLSVISLSRAVQPDTANPSKQQAVEKERRQWNAILGKLKDSTLAVDAKDINQAIDNITRARDGLTTRAGQRRQFKDASDDLETSLKAVNATVAQLGAVAKNNPNLLNNVAKMTGGTMLRTLEQAAVAAASANDRNSAESILAAARALANAMNGLLNSAKYLSASKTPQTLQNLDSSSQNVSLAIMQVSKSLGNAASPEVTYAMKQIMDIIQAIDHDPLTIAAAASASKSRESLLAAFLASAKDMARVTGALVNASKGPEQQHGIISQDLSRTACELLKVSTAVANPQAGGNGPVTAEAQTIVKAVDSIAANPSQAGAVNANLKRIMECSSSIIGMAHNSASQFEDDKDKKESLIREAQDLVAAVTGLTQVSRDVAPGKPETTRNLVNSARRVQTHAVQIDKLLNGDAEEEEEEMDSALASKLKSSTRAIGLAAHEVIRASAMVNGNPNDGSATVEMSNASKMVSETVRGLLSVVNALNPGAKECEKAIQDIQKASLELDAANFAAGIGTLDQHLQPSGKSAQKAREESAELAKELVEHLSQISSTVSAPQELKKAIEKVRKDVPDLIARLMEAAGASSDQPIQVKILGSAKKTTDQVLQLIRAVHLASMNDRQGINSVPGALQNAQGALASLLSDLQTSGAIQQDLEKFMRMIKEALEGLRTRTPPAATYRACKQELNDSARDALIVLMELSRADKNNTASVRLAVSRVADKTTKLVKSAHLCACTTTDQPTSGEIISSTGETGISIIRAINELKKITSGAGNNPDDFNKEVEKTRQLIQKLVTAVKKGAVGEVMLEQAIKSVSDSVALLNTASIFDEAGQLEEHNNTKAMTIQNLQGSLQAMVTKFGEHCAYISKISQVGSDEDLGTGAISLAEALKKIANITVATASKLNDAPLSRKELLTNGKLVTLANSQLLLSTKNLKLQDSEQGRMAVNQSLNSVQRQLRDLIAAVHQVGAEASQTATELENSINILRELLRSCQPQDSTMDEVFAATKEVLVAAANLIFAPTREDIVNSGKETVESMQKLIATSKGISKACPDKAVAAQLDTTTKDAAGAIIGLLEVSKLPRSDPETQPRLEAAGAKVTQTINTVIDSLRKFPNVHAEQLEDVQDLDSLAEQELMKCAEIIENAAKMLLSAQNNNGMVDLSQLNEAILAAAKQIALATGELVKQSIYAQRERSQSERKAAGGKYHVDPMWTNGLISASQQVAKSVQELVNQANAAATGQGSEEALVASSRGVAASTAHLLSAARAKADAASPTQVRLGQAAKQVAHAGSKLVIAAQTMRAEDEPEENFNDMSSVARKKAEMEINIRIKEVEKRLEEERRALGRVHARKYK